ncbi:MAG: PIG-L family deacetylase [Marinisporobacter sp.]|nr:PIG-L family deacetylase [Marinisporobacter sp.]
MEKILVIAAHPDDEILGLGATVKKLINEGNKAYALILSCGVTSRSNIPEYEIKKEIEKLKKQSIAASKIIGFKEIFFCDFPDNRFDRVPLLEIIKIIEKYINKIKPSIVFTHHYSDVNIDHKKTFQAVITATRPFGEYSVKEIYCFETYSSTEWNFPYTYYFKPNVFIDIEKTFRYKVEAMKCYTSEIREYPHPRSIENLKIGAKRWGATVGCNLVEAFELIRKVKR